MGNDSSFVGVNFPQKLRNAFVDGRRLFHGQHLCEFFRNAGALQPDDPKWVVQGDEVIGQARFRVQHVQYQCQDRGIASVP